MWNFPTPLPDELIYSTIARAGLHHGIQSPKQLLDEVYQDRKVVATIDLPSHLNAVVHLLERTGCFSLIDLIYKHTILVYMHLLFRNLIDKKSNHLNG